MTEISRRKFIQLTVLGGAAAALTEGCANQRYPEAEVTGRYGGANDRALPYLNQPNGLRDGVPQWFATACQMCPAGCGLFVRTIGGRAVKLEGNPDHPVSHGKTCARGQASLQHLYNPDRLRFPAIRAARAATAMRTDWETALGRVAASLLASPQAGQGRVDTSQHAGHGRVATSLQAGQGHVDTSQQAGQGRVAILGDAMTLGRSPTLSRLVQQFAGAIGASVTAYSLLDEAPWRAAARAVYGRDQIPSYQLDGADYLLSFSGNFLEAWPSPVHYSWLFGQFRQGPRRTQGEHGRFVYVGPRMSMTAAKADLWLPCNPGTESAVALGILTALGGPGISVAQAAGISGLSVQQINEVARGFAAAGPRAVALGGDGLVGQPNATAAMVAVESLNAQVKSQLVGFGVAALPTTGLNGQSSYRQLQSLQGAMQAGKIAALLILGQPNPVFTLPQAAGFSEAMARVPFIAALTPFEDETTAAADVVLPTRTFLEDWGDDIPAVIPSGSRLATLRQPIIDPSFIPAANGAKDQGTPGPWMDTRGTGDILIDLARRLSHPLPDADMSAAVRRTWAGIGQADLAAATTDNDPKWVTALAQGGVWAGTSGAIAVGRVPAAQRAPIIAPPAPDTFALHLYPHLYWADGRHANLPWLQEIPDPMTSAVWNTWVEINLQTAERLGIRTGDIVRLTTAHGSLEVPALPYPAIHPDVVAMPIGQGHGHGTYGRNAAGRGVNPLAILDPSTDAVTGALAYGATRVQLVKVRSAVAGYNPELNTLVLVQDRPGGAEPEAVRDLIHTTAKEWKSAPPVAAPTEGGSIFHRESGISRPGAH